MGLEEIFMKITDVRVRIVQGEDRLKAVAVVTLDDSFVIHDVKIIDGRDGFFISMPNKKTPDGKYKDIVHPIKSDVREEMKKEILKAYNDALSKEE